MNVSIGRGILYLVAKATRSFEFLSSAERF